MHYQRAVTSLIVLLLGGLCLSAQAYAQSSDEVPWNMRVGTIGWLRTLDPSSHAHIYLDAEDIVKIKAKLPTPYILIAEPFSLQDRLILEIQPSPLLRLMQTVDIEGDVTISSDTGQITLENVTVWGYTDSAGCLLYRGPLIKGLLSPTPWDWLVNLTVQTQLQSVHAAASEAPGEPNANLSAGPTFYPRVADVVSPSASQTQGAQAQSYYPNVPSQGLSDGALVELEAKPIVDAGVQTVDEQDYNYIDIQDDGGTHHASGVLPERRHRHAPEPHIRTNANGQLRKLVALRG